MHVIKKLPILSFCVLLFFSVSGLAQHAPFTGGDGDGYDMAVWEGSTGVDESFSNQFQLAPQPVSNRGWLHIQSSLPIQRADISILDITGKQLFTRSWKSGESFSFQLPSLATGFYVLHIHTAEKLAVKKVQIVSE